MLIPVLLVGLVGLGAYKAICRPDPVGMTVKRVQIYQAALATLKDPEKLRTLAQAYEDAGCLAEARILKQRANLRELPKHVRAQRRDVFARAIRSSNPDAVRKVAEAFASEGALGAAENLRRHANSLIEEAELMKVYSESIPPAPPTSPTVGEEEDEDDVGETEEQADAEIDSDDEREEESRGADD
jgi:hypothetical protein